VKHFSHTFPDALTKFMKNLCKSAHIWDQVSNLGTYKFEVEMFKFYLGF